MSQVVSGGKKYKNQLQISSLQPSLIVVIGRYVVTGENVSTICCVLPKQN